MYTRKTVYFIWVRETWFTWVDSTGELRFLWKKNYPGKVSLVQKVQDVVPCRESKKKKTVTPQFVLVFKIMSQYSVQLKLQNYILSGTFKQQVKTVFRLDSQLQSVWKAGNMTTSSM